MDQSSCACMRSGPLRDARAATFLGLDHAGGRFAEIEIEECTYCRRRWLHYELEYDGLPGSARWFRGPLPDSSEERVTPEAAVTVLQNLDWYFAGGEYFGPGIRRMKGPLPLDR